MLSVKKHIKITDTYTVIDVTGILNYVVLLLR